MADVMNSLFGMTPESLMAQRDQALQTQAQQYAQLDPFQRATAGIYAGANRLGGAIGGMLGAQDPEMMRMQQRQSTLQGLDLSNPESLKQGIQQAMQNKDYQLVSELTNRYQQSAAAALEARVKESVITKNTAEQRAAATPADIAKAQRVAAIKAAIPAYKAAGDAQTVKLLEDELTALQPAAKAPDFGDEAERYSLQFYKKPYFELSQTEMAKVNAKVEETAKERGTKIVLPGQQVPQKEWLPFAEYLDKNPLVKKTTDLISAAPAALETIRMSTSNDIASTALAPQLARMAGETGALSANDVNRWAKSGGLDDRLIGSATSFFTGKTTVAKKEQAEKYVSAVFRGALLEQKRTLQDKAKEFGYLDSPNYKARLESIDAQLARFKKPAENKPSEAGAYSEAQVNAVLQKYQQPK